MLQRFMGLQHQASRLAFRVEFPPTDSRSCLELSPKVEDQAVYYRYIGSEILIWDHFLLQVIMPSCRRVVWSHKPFPFQTGGGRLLSSFGPDCKARKARGMLSFLHGGAGGNIFYQGFRSKSLCFLVTPESHGLKPEAALPGHWACEKYSSAWQWSLQGISG